MHVELRGPGDQRHQIDTPDPALVGQWLKAIFDDLGAIRTHYPKTGWQVPAEFMLRIQ